MVGFVSSLINMEIWFVMQLYKCAGKREEMTQVWEWEMENRRLLLTAALPLHAILDGSLRKC